MGCLKKSIVIFLAAMMVFQATAVNTFAALPKNTTKTTTKTITKTETLSKKATKTYSKTTKKTSTSSKKTQATEYTKTVKTTVLTTTKKSYTKGSKKVKVKITKKTTVKTTYAAKDFYRDLTAAEKCRIGTKVSNAFSTLGFRVLVQAKTSGYEGATDIAKKTIYLAYDENESNIIYHEIGHFVSFIAGNACKTDEFVEIYNAEKSKYTKYNKSYVTSSAAEYFAECYKLYLTEPLYLLKNMPKTYNFMPKALNRITDSKITLLKAILN